MIMMAAQAEDRNTENHETFQLGPFVVPRIWTGLWQLSSNAWGSAPTPKIKGQMTVYAERGYTAFGMSNADIFMLRFDLLTECEFDRHGERTHVTK